MAKLVPDSLAYVGMVRHILVWFSRENQPLGNMVILANIDHDSVKKKQVCVGIKNLAFLLIF